MFAPPAPPRRPLPWALGLIALALPPLPILAQIPAPAEIPTETEAPPSQLRAGDWAYQALTERLAEPGCPPGADALLRGGQPIERFEAAALLQACLGAVGAATDRDRRLLEGFAAELALLRGRSDGLEARLGELEATRFAPTTKLGGLATFVVGGNRYGSGRSALRDSANASGGATSFSVDLQLAFDTSFGGQDQLRVLLRSGNFGDSPFGGDGPGGPLSTLEIAFQEDCGTGVDCGEVLAVEKLFLRWPLGAGLTAVVGGHVGQEDMLPLWPSVYPADTVLNVFTLNGAPLAYSKNLGPGAGLWWQGGGLSLAANAVAANGDSGDPDPPAGRGGRARSHPLPDHHPGGQPRCDDGRLGAGRLLAAAEQRLAALAERRLGLEPEPLRPAPAVGGPAHEPVVAGGAAVDGHAADGKRVRHGGGPTGLRHPTAGGRGGRRWRPDPGGVASGCP